MIKELTELLQEIAQFTADHWETILVVVVWFKKEIKEFVPKFWVFCKEQNGLTGVWSTVYGKKETTKEKETNETKSIG